MKILEPSPKLDRRSFIKKVLNGTIAGSLYLAFPIGGNTLDLPEQIPGIKGKPYDIQNQEFAFIVDITRCIGCGSCTFKCPGDALPLKRRDLSTVPPDSLSELNEKIIQHITEQLSTT